VLISSHAHIPYISYVSHILYTYRVFIVSIDCLPTQFCEASAHKITYKYTIYKYTIPITCIRYIIYISCIYSLHSLFSETVLAELVLIRSHSNIPYISYVSHILYTSHVAIVSIVCPPTQSFEASAHKIAHRFTIYIICITCIKYKSYIQYHTHTHTHTGTSALFTGKKKSTLGSLRIVATTVCMMCVCVCVCVCVRVCDMTN